MRYKAAREKNIPWFRSMQVVKYLILNVGDEKCSGAGLVWRCCLFMVMRWRIL